MQPFSGYTLKHFENAIAQIAMTRRLLQQRIRIQLISERLERLIERVEKQAQASLEVLKELTEGTDASQMLSPQVQQILRSLRKEQTRMTKGEEPYVNRSETSRAYKLLESLQREYLPHREFPREKTWQEYAIELEQEMLNQDQGIYHDFQALLEKISLLAENNEAFLIDPFVHKTYARPEDIHDFWMVPFLQTLRENMELGGINVSMDMGDYEGETQEAWLEDKIEFSSSLIVVGSENLARKNKEGDSAVTTELALVRGRREESDEDPLLPVLVQGSKQTGFPPGFVENVINEQVQGKRMSYLYLLKALMEEIFQVPKGTNSEARREWEKLWNAFTDKYPQFKEGLSQEDVEKHVLGNPLWIAQREQIQAEATRKLLEKALEKEIDETEIAKRLKIFYGTKKDIERLIGSPLPIDKHYTQLVMVKEKEQKNKDFEKKADFNGIVKLAVHDNRLNSWEDIHRPKEPIALEQIFSEKTNKTANRVLILGRAGIGKSVLCQYISYQWSEKGLWSGRYDAVFWVQLRQLLNIDDRSTMSSFIQEQCGLEDLKINPGHIEKFIEKNSDRVLFILDGYDEVFASLDDNPAQKKVMQQLLQQKHWMMTSRPYAVSSLASDQKGDRVIESIGFDSEGITQYVTNFFGDTRKGQELLDQLEKNPLTFGSAHVPLNLELICGIWADRQKRQDRGRDIGSLTLTDLYEELSLNLQRRFYIREGQKEAVDWDDFDFEEQTAYLATIHTLEAIAWMNLAQQDIIFSPKQKEIRGVMNQYRKGLKQNEARQWMENLQKFGLLRSSGEGKGFRNNEYYFIHLSFQEFFAARYIKRLLVEEDKRVRKMILTHKFNPRYQVVWWFLAGLLRDDSDLLNQFFDLLDESKDLIGSYALQLKVRCLEECQFSDELDKLEDYIDEIKRVFSSKGTTSGTLVKNIVESLKMSPSFIEKHLLAFLLENVKQGMAVHASLELVEIVAKMHVSKARKIVRQLIDLEGSDVSKTNRTLVSILEAFPDLAGTCLDHWFQRLVSQIDNVEDLNFLEEPQGENIRLTRNEEGGWSIVKGERDEPDESEKFLSGIGHRHPEIANAIESIREIAILNESLLELVTTRLLDERIKQEGVAADVVKHILYCVSRHVFLNSTFRKRFEEIVRQRMESGIRDKRADTALNRGLNGEDILAFSRRQQILPKDLVPNISPKGLQQGLGRINRFLRSAQTISGVLSGGSSIEAFLLLGETSLLKWSSLVSTMLEVLRDDKRGGRFETFTPKPLNMEDSDHIPEDVPIKAYILGSLTRPSKWLDRPIVKEFCHEALNLLKDNDWFIRDQAKYFLLSVVEETAEFDDFFLDHLEKLSLNEAGEVRANVAYILSEMGKVDFEASARILANVVAKPIQGVFYIWLAVRAIGGKVKKLSNVNEGIALIFDQVFEQIKADRVILFCALLWYLEEGEDKRSIEYKNKILSDLDQEILDKVIKTGLEYIRVNEPLERRLGESVLLKIAGNSAAAQKNLRSEVINLVKDESEENRIFALQVLSRLKGIGAFTYQTIIKDVLERPIPNQEVCARLGLALADVVKQTANSIEIEKVFEGVWKHDDREIVLFAAEVFGYLAEGCQARGFKDLDVNVLLATRNAILKEHGIQSVFDELMIPVARALAARKDEKALLFTNRIKQEWAMWEKAEEIHNIPMSRPKSNVLLSIDALLDGTDEQVAESLMPVIQQAAHDKDIAIKRWGILLLGKAGTKSLDLAKKCIRHIYGVVHTGSRINIQEYNDESESDIDIIDLFEVAGDAMGYIISAIEKWANPEIARNELIALIDAMQATDDKILGLKAKANVPTKAEREWQRIVNQLKVVSGEKEGQTIGIKDAWLGMKEQGKRGRERALKTLGKALKKNPDFGCDFFPLLFDEGLFNHAEREKLIAKSSIRAMVSFLTENDNQEVAKLLVEKAVKENIPIHVSGDELYVYENGSHTITVANMEELEQKIAKGWSDETMIPLKTNEEKSAKLISDNEDEAFGVRVARIIEEGKALSEKEDYKRAVQSFVQAYQILEKELGKKHTFTIDTVRLLNEAESKRREQSKINRLNNALEEIQKSLEEEELEIKEAFQDELEIVGEVLAHKYGNQGLYEQAIKYTQEALNRIEETEDQKGLASCLGNLAWWMAKGGKYKEARACCERAFRVYQEVYGDDYQKHCYFIIDTQALIELKLHRYSAALDYAKEALRLSLQFGDEADQIDYYARLASIQLELDDPDAHETGVIVFESLGSLVIQGSNEDLRKSLVYIVDGLTAAKRGEEDAFYHLQKAVDTCRYVPKLFQEELADSLYALGLGYHLLEIHEKALESLQQALAMQRKSLPQNHASIAESLHRIGLSYIQLGEYQKALRALKEAYKIMVQLDDADNPFAKEIQTLLGVVEDDEAQVARWIEEGNHHSAQGDYQEAVTCFKKAYRILVDMEEDKSSPSILGVLKIMSGAQIQFAEALRQLGRGEEALKVYSENLEMYQGIDHVSRLLVMIQMYRDIGVTYGELGDRPNEVKNKEIALELAKAILGEDHLETGIIMYMLGQAYAESDKAQESLPHFQKVKEIFQKELGEQHSIFIQALNALAVVLGKIVETLEEPKDPEKALEIYNQLLLLHKQIDGELSQNAASVYLKVGEIYNQQEEYKKAAESFRSAYAIIVGLAGESHHFAGAILKLIEQAEEQAASSKV